MKIFLKILTLITPSSLLCLCLIGLPKPAIINQTKAMKLSRMFQLLDYTSSDTVYVVTPLYHSSATLLGVFNTIDAGKDRSIYVLNCVLRFQYFKLKYFIKIKFSITTFYIKQQSRHRA